MVDVHWMQEQVRTAVPDADVHATDLGGGDHWHCVVVSATFAEERSFARQKRVLAVFKEPIRTGIVHALDLKCLTPDELASKGMPKPFVPHQGGGMHPVW